MAYRAVLISVF